MPFPYNNNLRSLSAALTPRSNRYSRTGQAWTLRLLQQALALQHSRPADLLITDIFMPGQEGFETMTRCKSEFPQTRIIVMSAGTIPGMKHDFLSTAALLGVAATLRKPFDADQLLDTVRRVLQPG